MQRDNGKNRIMLGARILVSLAALTVAAGGASAAPTETVLHTFTGFSSGNGPLAGLLADSAGNLYGTTINGGAAGGGGVVFKLTPPIPPATSWTETVLYTFCSLTNCSDGGSPQAGLIADGAGNLYGTTALGGAPGCGNGGAGCGVVFKLAPPIPLATSWTQTVLYTFTGGTDGAKPFAGLIAGSAGNLYGTTFSGGAPGCGGAVVGCGAVFKLAPPIPPATSWTQTVLYTFCSQTLCSDGKFPGAGLIADSSGNLYGTTEEGGASQFQGAVFKLAPPIPPATTWTETVLTQAVALQVGPFSATLPPGSFTQTGPLFTFAGSSMA